MSEIDNSGLFEKATHRLKLTLGDTVRYVKNIVISNMNVGCSLVNDGHDDLYDLGFRSEEFDDHELKIESIN